MHQIRFLLGLCAPQTSELYLRDLVLRGGREVGGKGKVRGAGGRDMAHPKFWCGTPMA